MQHLVFDTLKSSEKNISTAPEKYMASLGIHHWHVRNHNLGDQVYFLCCTNIPEKLPDFITVLDIDLQTLVDNFFTEEHLHYLNGVMDATEAYEVERRIELFNVHVLENNRALVAQASAS